MTSSANAARNLLLGPHLVRLGLVLAFFGVIAYGLQITAKRLMAPWYMPTLAALGVVVVVASLVERRTVWRWVALLAVVLLTGAELALFYALRLPPYTGPILVGRPFPEFEAKVADGTAFTQRDLSGDQNSALVFFRGRW
jgi:hypothetical protein